MLIGHIGQCRVLLAVLLATNLVARLAVADTFTTSVIASADDAEENLITGAVNLTSSDLELSMDGAVEQLVGMRFRNVSINTAQTICSADITFTIDEANPGTSPYNYDPSDLTIFAQAIASAGGIGGVANNLSNRTPTAATVNWQPGLWTTVGATEVTTDLTAIINELISTHGFVSGNSMLFLIQGQGTRTAESINGSAANAPLLEIQYDDDPGCGSPTVFQLRETQGNNDAEENLATGAMDRTSTDLELASEDLGDKQAIGIRFQSITIPQFSTINSAFIDFTVDETDSIPTSLRIFGEDIDTSPQFTTGSGNITGRTPTSASVDWDSLPAWNTVGATETTPDLAAILQEIVNRGGWASGNAASFIIVGTGERTAESFDGSGMEPVLRVDFTPPTPNILVVKSVTVLEDPVTGVSANAKAIPGATVQYSILITNSGTASPDTDSLDIIDTIPANTAIVMDDFGGVGSGPVGFVDGSPSSGLTYTFISVSDLADDIVFLDAADSPIIPAASGLDPSVRKIVINPKGTFGFSTTGNPSFTLMFKVEIQ